MTTPEGKVKHDIKRFLATLGEDVWYFMPVPGGYGTNGVPDFIICYRGTFVAIEAKAPGKLDNTTPLQRMQIRNIHKASGHALVVDNVETLKVFFRLL